MSRCRALLAECGLIAGVVGAAVAQGPIPRSDGSPALATVQAVRNPGLIPSEQSRTGARSGRLGVSADPACQVNQALAYRESSTGGARHRGTGMALLIVGAAGAVAGLLTKDGLITVLGVSMSLVGLYVSLR